MPAKRQREKPSIEEYEVAGHSVKILTQESRVQLWIDDVRHKFYQIEGGYILYVNAYSPPQESLIEAVAAYLERISAEDEQE